MVVHNSLHNVTCVLADTHAEQFDEDLFYRLRTAGTAAFIPAVFQAFMLEFACSARHIRHLRSFDLITELRYVLDMEPLDLKPQEAIEMEKFSDLTSTMLRLTRISQFLAQERWDVNFHHELVVVLKDLHKQYTKFTESKVPLPHAHVHEICAETRSRLQALLTRTKAQQYRIEAKTEELQAMIQTVSPILLAFHSRMSSSAASC